MELEDRVVIITGAGRGLGLAYARGLATAGARILINDVDEAAAQAAVDRIEADGGTAHKFVAPVGTSEVADRMIEEAASVFGRADGLITNAGILRDKVLWKMTDDDFDAVINVHMKGTFTCVRSFVQYLRKEERRGKIVTIGSPAGQGGNFGQTNYSGAKAGVVGMVRTWAKELSRNNIDVNAVIPVAATEMTKTIPAFAPHIEAWEREGIPFPAELRTERGFGIPEDVVGLMVFLMSDASNGITGEAIGIGGDKVTRWAHPQPATSLVSHQKGWSAEALADRWRELSADSTPASESTR